MRSLWKQNPYDLIFSDSRCHLPTPKPPHHIFTIWLSASPSFKYTYACVFYFRVLLHCVLCFWRPLYQHCLVFPVYILLILSWCPRHRSAMDSADLASIPWFVELMLLHNRGLIPSVSPTNLLPSQRALAEFFGPKYNSDVIFDNHDDAQYENYIRQLYSCVLQLHWPVNSVIPFRFVRDVLAEANGLKVNWAEFAYKPTHPHQSHSQTPRVLIEYENLEYPLAPLVKITPRLGPEVSPTPDTDMLPL